MNQAAAAKKAWWGPGIPGHPWWAHIKFLSGGFRFEAVGEAGAIRQAEDAYRLYFPRVRVEIARDESDYRAALRDLGKTNVLKICPVPSS